MALWHPPSMYSDSARAADPSDADRVLQHNPHPDHNQHHYALYYHRHLHPHSPPQHHQQHDQHQHHHHHQPAASTHANQLAVVAMYPYEQPYAQAMPPANTSPAAGSYAGATFASVNQPQPSQQQQLQRQDIPVQTGYEAQGTGTGLSASPGDDDVDEEDEEADDDGDEGEADLASDAKGKKRLASTIAGATSGSAVKAKQVRLDDGGKGKSAHVMPPDGAKAKAKTSRGSRACTVCRRLKMRCVGAEDGPPCKRCKQGNHECIFEESQRGKRSTKRTDVLARNLKTMEEKLDLVMSKMGSQPTSSTPVHVAGPLSTPSPSLSSQLHLPHATPPSADVINQHVSGWPAQVLSSVAQPAASAAYSSVVSPSTHHPAPSMSPGHETRLQRSNAASHALTHNHNHKLSFVVPPSITSQDISADAGGVSNASKDVGPARPSSSSNHARFAPDVGVKEEDRNGSVLGSGSRPSSPRLHSLPDNTLNPLGLLAEASLHNRHRKMSHRRSGARKDPDRNRHSARFGSASDDSISSSDAQHIYGLSSSSRRVGVANQAYFQPGPMNILPLRRIVIEQRMPPSLLTDKVLSSEEAVELFQLYFERCNPHCCILEPQVHTPTTVGSRSPFLFTAVCAVASKYYSKRKDLYMRCLHAAKRCAFDVLVKGYKSVEIVQALLLLSLWNQPAERFEEDRTWAFSGIAIRMATDLNLHRKTTAKLAPSVDDAAVIQYEREILNRERTWLYCFITDRALSAQMGKPYTIREDWIVRHSKHWHKQRCSVAFDYGLMAMVDLHRKFARILDTLYSDSNSISGLNTSLDYSVLMRTFSYDLEQWHVGWDTAGRGSPDDQIGGYRHSMKEFYYNYYRLFTMSFMLQHALKNPGGELELSQVFVICYDAATRVIKVSRDYLGPSGALRYAPDSQFVYIAYAAVFMLKLIRPEFRPLNDEMVMLNLVQDVITLLEDLAVDDTHTPALYATFLRVLVTSKQASAAPSRAEPRIEEDVDEAHMSSQQPTPEQIENALRKSQLAGVDGPTPTSEPSHQNNGHATSVAARVTTDATPIIANGTAVADEGGMRASQPHPAIPQAADNAAGINIEHDGTTGDMDNVLRDARFLDGFWESMLMPGYSGPLDGLSGGTGLVSVYQNGTDAHGGYSFTPAASGRTTPTHLFTQSSLDLGNVDYNPHHV